MQKSQLVFGAIGVLVLAALFWMLKPPVPAPAMPAQEPGVKQAAADSATPEAASQPVHIEIKQGQRQAGPEVVRVRQGEKLSLVFSSDQDAELHLHGYDLHVHLHAGKSTELTFVAEHSGRFEYELHGQPSAGHAALGVIEVLPR